MEGSFLWTLLPLWALTSGGRSARRTVDRQLDDLVMVCCLEVLWEIWNMMAASIELLEMALC